MLKTIRVILAAIFWVGITALLAIGTGVLYRWLGWMPKLQFLPAVLAMNFAVIAGLVLLTLLFGRVYCSVICPLGVFQDGIAHVGATARRHRKHKAYGWSPEKKWLRYGVLALFVLALVFGVQAFVALLAPYSAWGRIVNVLTPGRPWTWTLLAVAAVTLVAVVILAWRGGRTYCNTICPVGTTLGFISRFAAFRPVIDADKCKNCHICENGCKASCIDIASHSIDHSRCVACFDCLGDCKFDALHYRFSWKKKIADQVGNDAGRRAFLASLALLLPVIALRAQKKTDGGLATVLPKKAVKRSIPITPPGSRSVKDFYSKCTACQLCIAHCPNKVLRPSSSPEHFMQPELGYENGWCRPECTSCSEYCPTGAIELISREEKTQYHIGTASVNRELCVAEKGTQCGNCAQKCPTGAISMVPGPAGTRVPAVNESICIGCGACEFLCPARPVSAITVNGRHEHLKS
ncbi:MAG: 4Fe-4S binding protein [Bacteroidales bacterium]|nr:4Fe-4S binding protein [Bacteroidales bacterium]